MPLLMCPNCQVGMKEVTRNNVQIDICPDCRGVWLDRGELEKLLGAVRQVETEWSDAPSEYPVPPNVQQVGSPPPLPQHPPQQGYYDLKYRNQHKRANPFTEIFDIFD